MIEHFDMNKLTTNSEKNGFGGEHNYTYATQ